MENSEIVLKTLKNSDTPMKTGDIAEKAGIDKKEVEKAIKKLLADNKITSPKRCFYKLSK
jgi:predicted transcriptional regulator